MATITVFHESVNKYYQINVGIFSSVVDAIHDVPSDGSVDFYLKITTNMKKPDGSSFSEYLVRELSDVPVGYSTATTFTELVNDYIEYFIVQSEFGQSSSSSTSSTSSNSSSSSTTSSSTSSNSSSSTSSNSSSSTLSSTSSSYIELWSSSSSSSSSSVSP